MNTWPDTCPRCGALQRQFRATTTGVHCAACGADVEQRPSGADLDEVVDEGEKEEVG